MQHRLPLSAVEIENRLKKIPDLAVDLFCNGVEETVNGVNCITVMIDHGITDGLEIKFRSPVACSAISRLCVKQSNSEESKIFAFADANGNDIGEIDNLFAANAVVKVILDLDTNIDHTDGVAFVQNADTNAYLEGCFADIQEQLNNASTGTEDGGNVFGDSENNKAGELAAAFGEQSKALGYASFVTGARQDASGAPDNIPDDSEYWRYNEAHGTGSMASGMGAVAYSRASKSLGYRTQTGYPPNAEEAAKRPEALTESVELSTGFSLREITTLHSSIDKISDNSVDMTLDNIYSEELQDGTTYITESGKILIGIDCDTVPSKIKITAPTTTFCDASIQLVSYTSPADYVVHDSVSFSYDGEKSVELKLNNTVNSGNIGLIFNGGSFVGGPAYLTVYITLLEYPTENEGQAAVAIGSDTAAVGKNSLAGGWKSNATGSRAVAIGSQVVASGEASVAFGDRTKANGDKSIAAGMYSQANGSRSIAAGHLAITDGDISFAFGNNVQTNANSQTVLGKFNTPDADALFVIGNGSDTEGDGIQAVTNNAFVVKEYGDVIVSGDIYMNEKQLLATQDYTNTVFSQVPVKKTATGGLLFGGHPENDANANSIAFGGSTANGPVKATAQNSMAIGENTTASGRTSLASGLSTTASGSRSAAFGNGTTASGIAAVAIGDGTTAEGNKSFAAGWLSKASGQQSMAVGRSATTTTDANAACALGLFTQANAEGQIAAGKYNVADKDAIFIVGNGSSSGRSNALAVKTNGDMNVAGNAYVNGDKLVATQEYVSQSAVLFDRKQSLTREQQIQARENINAAGLTDLDVNFTNNVSVGRNFKAEYVEADTVSARTIVGPTTMVGKLTCDYGLSIIDGLSADNIVASGDIYAQGDKLVATQEQVNALVARITAIENRLNSLISAEEASF